MLGSCRLKAPCLPKKWIPYSAETLLREEGKQRKLQTESICVCFPVYLGIWTVLQGGVSWSLRSSYLVHRPVGHVVTFHPHFLLRCTSSTYLEQVLEICSIGTRRSKCRIRSHSSKSPLLLQILESFRNRDFWSFLVCSRAGFLGFMDVCSGCTGGRYVQELGCPQWGKGRRWGGGDGFWSMGKKEEEGEDGAWQPELGSVYGRIHLSSFSPKLYGAGAVWGILFPKKLSTPLLFCIHYIKRILISRKLAWSFCLLWSVCATWQSVNGPTEKLTKNKAENLLFHCQPFQVSRLANAWQLLVCLLAFILLCPAGNLRSKPSGWDEVNHPRNYSVWASSARGNGLFGKYSFHAKNEKRWFFLTHLVFCNVGYFCLGQSCRWQNVFPAVPSESSLWFEGTATAPCGETCGHPTQRSVLHIPTFQSKVCQGSQASCHPGGDGVLSTGEVLVVSAGHSSHSGVFISCAELYTHCAHLSWH